MNEINTFENLDIIVQPPILNFPQFDDLKKEALEVAQLIDSLEVTDDNIKANKKILAQVNTSVKELNNKRIAIKKDMLKPYEVFAEQIKEIETIVKNSDEKIRNQIRQIEEKQREAKKEALKEIWITRVAHYEFAKIIKFEDWLDPKHLNKTVSINQSEGDMITSLERYERDLKTLSEMDLAEQLINEYIACQDVSLAIATVASRNKKIEAQQEMLKHVVDKVEKHIYELFNDKDARMLELLMENNGIEYRKLCQ